MNLLLDIANEIYPLKADERFHCVLSHSLQPSSTVLSTTAKAASSHAGAAPVEEGFYDPDCFDQESLADRFDYVMYGKIYKAEETPMSKIAIYTSFGGLLMRLEGDPRHWNNLKVGASVYILMKKI